MKRKVSRQPWGENVLRSYSQKAETVANEGLFLTPRVRGSCEACRISDYIDKLMTIMSPIIPLSGMGILIAVPIHVPSLFVFKESIKVAFLGSQVPKVRGVTSMLYRETIISWILSLILWLDGTIELSTLGIEWVYFVCKRQGNEYLWPKE